MCSVSAVTGYGMGIPDHLWTPQTWPPFKQLVEKAVEFDKVAEQPDCIDPAKDEWMKRIEERITKLEAEAFRRA
jgi:hypothetical protein